MNAIAPPATIKISKSKMEWTFTRAELEVYQSFGSSRLAHTSPAFGTSPDNEISWSLKFYPRGDNFVNRDYITLYLNGKDITEPARVKYRLGLIDSEGVEKNTIEEERIFMNTETLRWPRFISRQELFNPTRNFFKDNKITIFCDLEIRLNFNLQQVPECGLIEDFSDMLESGDLSDVTLVVGQEEIKAHKVVLAARSDVFAAMFNHNMLENQTGRVEIEDLDVVGVKGLLRFLYSGKVEDLKAIAEKVLPAADKYAVERLKLMCENELCEKITVENAVQLLTLADLHTAKQLKAHVLAFIKADASEVVQQDSFWELADDNKDLLKEAVCFYFRESDEPQAKRRKLN